MADTLTILACDPNGDGMDDPAIAELVPKFQAIAADPAKKHIFKRASSIEQLGEVLYDHRAALPLTVQVIGHGAPGVLWLGRPWKDVFSEDADGPVYVLDSTPYYYGILAGLVPRPAVVSLLGCAVGDTDATTADGPTLLFDLAQMWECRVNAPVDVIGVDDFNDDGLFRNPERLATAQGNCITPPPAGIEPITTAGTEDITFVRLQSVPVLGPRKVPDIPIPPTLANALRLPRAKQMALKTILGAPETRMRVLLSGAGPLEAEVFGNSRIIRVATPGGPRTFVIDPARRAEFRQAQRQLIRNALRLP